MIDFFLGGGGGEICTPFHFLIVSDFFFLYGPSLSLSSPKPRPSPLFPLLFLYLGTATVKAFDPATIANLGPGFDFLGCAVDGLGDFISLTVDPQVLPGEISISKISGDHNNSKKLRKNPIWNCTGIAAIEVMKMLGVRSVFLSLSLQKGLPLGTGLGSSTASVATVAVNEIFGGKLGVEELVHMGLKSEEKSSGYHADLIFPALTQRPRILLSPTPSLANIPASGLQKKKLLRAERELEN